MANTRSEILANLATKDVANRLDNLESQNTGDQNVFSTVNADTGSTTADQKADSLTVTGGTNITTTLFGDTLTIDGAPDQTAAQVPYDNATSQLAATNVQQAVDQLDSRVDTAESNISGLQAASHTHSNKAVLDEITSSGSGDIITTAERTKLQGIEAGATADQTASEVPIVDAGAYYLSGEVENALQEVGAVLQTIQSNNTGTNTGDQNVYTSVATDSGTSTADTTTETLTIVGAGGIVTSAVGDVITIDGTAIGAGGGYTDEQAQDAVGLAITTNATHDGVSVVYDDANNAINITNTDKGTTAVAAHEALPDPHPQYLTQAEGDALYNNTPAPNDALITLSAGDGLTGGGDFTTDQATPETITFVNADKGSTAVATHEAAPDPHPQYLTQAEADARYSQTDDQIASEVAYSNVTSGLTATNVQTAIDEVEGRVDTAEGNISSNTSRITTLETNNTGVNTGDQTAAEVPYSNATSGLTATELQSAVDELDSRLDTIEATPLTVEARDEGVVLTSAAQFLNFVGEGVSANLNGNGVDVVIPGVAAAEAALVAGVAGTNGPVRVGTPASFQTIPTNVETVVDLQTSYLDTTGTSVDLVNNRITIPEDGLYQFSGVITGVNPPLAVLQTEGDRYLIIRRVSDNAMVCVSETPVAQNDESGWAVQATIPALAGEQYDMSFFHANSSAGFGARHAMFAIAKVNGAKGERGIAGGVNVPVAEEGVLVEATPNIINFVGQNITATNNGTGGVNITMDPINDGTITITPGDGLGGGGDFTTNQLSPETITITNTDKGSAAVAQHEGLADPHPQYLTQAEGDTLYDPNGSASSAIAAHEAAPDPHPQYLTSAEGNAAYEPAGSTAAHEAASDPHPQYLTQAEGDARYDTSGAASSAIAAHEADTTAHPASSITYSNTTSGLTATNTQAALDEVEGRVDSLESVSHSHSNKAVLDAITNAGSGSIITLGERNKLNSIETGATADQSAAEVPYSNTTSGLTATNVQTAIDEVAANGGGTTPNDATITLSAGTGLSGGGNFTTNQGTIETITFTNADRGSTAVSSHDASSTAHPVYYALRSAVSTTGTISTSYLRAVLASQSALASGANSATIACSTASTTGSQCVTMASNTSSSTAGTLSANICTAGSTTGSSSSRSLNLATSQCSSINTESVCIGASQSQARALRQTIIASSFTLGTNGTDNVLDRNQVVMGVGSTQSTANRSIVLRANGGNILVDGTVQTNANLSDYAEMFPNLVEGQEIPVGLIVALEGDKVRASKKGDQIAGVVSGTATIIGNDSPLKWQGRFLFDEFGRVIWEEYQHEEEDGTFTTQKRRKENPDFDYDAADGYKSRSSRPEEWTCVGLLGQVYVRVDKSVQAGKSVSAGDNGIGTYSALSGKTGMRAMEITSPYDATKGYAVARCMLNVVV